MDYKLAVFDVDGTLRGGGRRFVSERMQKDIQTLRSRGVKVAIASGRPPKFVGPDYLDGLSVDYAVCVNGSCVLDGEGRVIKQHTLNQQQMDSLLSLYDTDNAMVDFVFYEGHYAYARAVEMREYFRIESGQVDDFFNGEERIRHKTDMPLGAFVCVADDIMQAYIEKEPSLQAAAYKSGAYDIYLSEVNKAVGLSEILAVTGIKRCETVAVGDGFNDLEMLKGAGIGVAMGNAPDEVKAVADRVTGTVEEDGAAEIIEQIFGI